MPTTCAAANGTTGCCADDGNAYRGVGQDASKEVCSAATAPCGWEPSLNQYRCGAVLSADILGGNPRRCGAAKNPLGCF